MAILFEKQKMQIVLHMTLLQEVHFWTAVLKLRANDSTNYILSLYLQRSSTSYGSATSQPVQIFLITSHTLYFYVVSMHFIVQDKIIPKKCTYSWIYVSERENVYNFESIPYILNQELLLVKCIFSYQAMSYNLSSIWSGEGNEYVTRCENMVSHENKDVD
jgi:hypothetical protein